MTGDPLDRIEAVWAQEYGPEEIDANIVRDVLALVEVARAARAYTKPIGDEWCDEGRPEDGEIPPWQGPTRLGDLFRALARLDGPR